MTSPEELKKALDLFQKEYNSYLELTEKILPGQPKEVRDFIESMLESLTLYNLFINRIKTDFATFKGEYDNQLHVPRFSVCMSNEDYDRMVHVPRKQLSGLVKEYVLENFGERCKDYAEHCPCCKAWKCYDFLTAHETSKETEK